MDLNFLPKSISIISAILAIVAFCTLLTWAAILFPGPYSPVDNYLSDLGNSTFNPGGALVFNIGCGIAGTFTILFFAGLNQWRSDGQWKLTISRLLGMFSGLMLILVGMFSEDYGKLHSLVAAVFFVSLIAAILSTDLALRKHPVFQKLIGYYGIIVALFSLIYIGTYLTGRAIIITEWITVIGSLGWMGLLAYNMLKLSHAPGASVKKTNCT